MLGVGEVVRRVKKTYGIDITRQTVYNWVKRGKGGTFLPATKLAGTLRISPENLHAFIRNTP